ncbi:MAG: type II toxin-antitoxin system RelE/ParE family toxin, partial [Ignavibacteria bacterium]
YIWLRESERFCYLYLITDMYSRKILGYWLSEDLDYRIIYVIIDKDVIILRITHRKESYK